MAKVSLIRVLSIVFLCGVFSACSDRDDEAQGLGEDVVGDLGSEDISNAEDTDNPLSEDISLLEDAEPDLSSEDTSDTTDEIPDTSEPDPPLDIDEPVDPDPEDPEWDPVFGAETIGTTIIFYPEALDGIFLFGLSGEFGSAISQLGNTAAGVLMIPVVVDLHHGKAKFRVVDPATGETEPGDDGVVESYPYFVDQEDRVHINFEQPSAALTVQLYQNCTYNLTGYQLMKDPAYQDGMITWGVLESYDSQNCGQWGLPESFGLNYHFLRRLDANPDFMPRTVDPASPFGYFQVNVEGGPNLLTRLPDIGAEFEDGKLEYFISDTFPEKLKPAIYDVAEDWNDAMEEMVGNRPFVILEEEGDMVPWDPRYRVIHWDGSSTQGAVAPFFESPVTGEIISSYVIFWLGEFDTIVEKYEKYMENYPDVPWMDFESSVAQPFPGWSEEDELPPNVLRRRQVERRPLKMGEIAMFAQRLGKDLTGDELAQYIIADFLSHELGHNIGLRHNFKGSMDLANLEEGIPSTTVMDYILGMPAPGNYDRGAVRYAYGDGVVENDFAYCTDENLALDPGCAQYDVGHPVIYYLELLDKLAAAYPPETSLNELQGVAQEQEWAKLFLRVRQFVNSEYETLNPDEPVYAMEGLLSRVECPDDCQTHIWFRNQMALYLLYTKHIVEDMWNPNGEGEWHDLPAYDDEQATNLLSAYFDLIMDPNQPMALKETILNKLPTSAVEGAGQLVTDLAETLGALENPTDDEQALIAFIENL